MLVSAGRPRGGRGEKYYTGGMQFDGVIFDLDGTLVDTLEDIADAMDRVLAREGAPGHTYEEYRYLIGHGIRNLVTESLPAGLRSEERIARCYERMIDDYGRNSLVKTRPYEGVPELIRELRGEGVPLAIHSNKSDELTQDIVAALLDPADFVAVHGARPDAPLKPDPAVALGIAARFGSPPARVLYLGDSLVDMRTATAAGMTAVGAAWGFRTREELVESGAAYVIDAPLDLLGAPRLTARAGCTASRRRLQRPRQTSAPAPRRSSANAGMSAGCAATTAGPLPWAAGARSTAAPASRAISTPAA